MRFIRNPCCLQRVMNVSCFFSGTDHAPSLLLSAFANRDRKALGQLTRCKRGWTLIRAEARSDRDPEDDYKPSRMLSSRQHLAERKAKQAGYVALRGPGQDVLPNERDRDQRESASGSAAGSSAAAVAPAASKPSAAAKAARRAAPPGGRPQGPPVPTIAPGQVGFVNLCSFN